MKIFFQNKGFKKKQYQDSHRAHRRRTGRTAVCVLFLCGLFLGGCAGKPQEFQGADTAMGTVIRQTVYVSGNRGFQFFGNAGEEKAEDFFRDAISCIRSLEQEYLSWRLENSEVFALNACAGSGEASQLSPWLAALLEQCAEVSEASGGAFDVTLGSVARLWDIDTWASGSDGVLGDAGTGADSTSYALPDEQAIAAALEAVGMDQIVLQEGSLSLPEGMQLDLGAVGKGVALDELKGVLTQHEEVTGAVLSLGGSILTYGSKPDGGTWNVGIVDPFDTSQNLGVLVLDGQWCVSTSGDYERYVEVDGVRYHHILDPSTGCPADSGVKSVTILSESGFLSDALSTACFVLGVEEGLALAEHYQAEALFVDAEGNIAMTAGMEEYFREKVPR